MGSDSELQAHQVGSGHDLKLLAHQAGCRLQAHQAGSDHDPKLQACETADDGEQPASECDSQRTRLEPRKEDTLPVEKHSTNQTHPQGAEFSHAVQGNDQKTQRNQAAQDASTFCDAERNVESVHVQPHSSTAGLSDSVTVVNNCNTNRKPNFSPALNNSIKTYPQTVSSVLMGQSTRMQTEEGNSNRSSCHSCKGTESHQRHPEKENPSLVHLDRGDQDSIPPSPCACLQADRNSDCIHIVWPHRW